MTTPAFDGPPVRVLLVDDQDLIRAGLRGILRASHGLDVVGELGDGAGVVAAVGELRPDVVEDDIVLVSLMTGAVSEFAQGVEPRLWRRSLALQLDGLRARRDGPTPLPVGPLDSAQVDRAMAARRPTRR